MENYEKMMNVYKELQTRGAYIFIFSCLNIMFLDKSINDNNTKIIQKLTKASCKTYVLHAVVFITYTHNVFIFVYFPLASCFLARCIIHHGCWSLSAVACGLHSSLAKEVVLHGAQLQTKPRRFMLNNENINALNGLFYKGDFEDDDLPEFDENGGHQ